MPPAQHDNTPGWIESIVRDFIDASGENRLQNAEESQEGLAFPLVEAENNVQCGAGLISSV